MTNTSEHSANHSKLEKTNLKGVVHLFHEIGMLAKIPRSGFAFLGSGSQSVADHSYRMALIGSILADLSDQPVNKERLLLICLFHDLPEARTGDLNNVQKNYVKADVKKVLTDLQNSSPIGNQICSYIEDYERGISIESILAHDADRLELLLALKEELERGNPRAQKWIDNCLLKLKTDVAKELAKVILQTPSEAWWMESLN